MKLPATLRISGLWTARNIKGAVAVITVSSFMAVLVTLLDPNNDLVDMLKISNAIGMSIWLLARLIRWLGRGRIETIPSVLLAVPFGLFIGSELATPTSAPDLFTLLTQDPMRAWRPMAVSLLVIGSATTFLIFFFRASEYRVTIEAEKRRSAEARQAETAAKLALLQAQIEPHFLFNTLANVQSMIEAEPVMAKLMLDHLNRYLRAALIRTRQSIVTLADELELIESVVVIAAMRLGARLTYRMAIPDNLRLAKLPPLLLQPLVENAIRHGIEPAVNGGEILIEAERKQETLILRVSDTGVGLSVAVPAGVGLANVRSRLTSLYGDQARLILRPNTPHGLVVELALPLNWS